MHMFALYDDPLPEHRKLISVMTLYLINDLRTLYLI